MQFTFLKTAAGVWYAVGYNEPGMLGVGYVSAREVTPVRILLPPVQVTHLVVSYFTAGLVATDGSLYIWGDNSFGQIGNNSTVSPWTTPQRVSLTNVTHLALGIYHSLAITGAGAYYVWGSNRIGQLGTGDFDPRLEPTRLSPPTGNKVVNVVSSISTVAVLTDAGTWYTNGQNQYGQAGNASWGSVIPTPTRFPELGGNRVVRMAAGDAHWAGLTEDGSWYVWGYNYDGELGLGHTNDVGVPQRLSLARGETIHHIVLGGYHGAALRSATYTPTLTPTATPAVCPGSKGFTTDTLPVVLDTPCQSIYHGPGSPSSDNVGSDALFDRYLMIYVHTVQLGFTLEVDLLSACTTNSCLTTFPSGTTEVTIYLPVAFTPQVLLTLNLHYAAPTTGDASRLGAVGSGAWAELSMAYKGSALLLGLACTFTALAMVLLCGGLWWWYQLRRKRQQSMSPSRRRNVSRELTKLLCSTLLAFGAWCLTVGVLWLIIAALTTRPVNLAPGVFIAGACLAGIGAALIAGCGLYLLRDPVAVQCPECNELVSRWKFRGTYVQPPDDTDAPFSKAHTSHVRCRLCARPVVQDKWPASTPCRPYHRDCWETFCSKAVADSHYFNAWWKDCTPRAYQAELVHMLAMAITKKDMAAVERFAQLDPRLIFAPIFLSGMRTPVQLAALHGHRPIVELLLRHRQQRTLDASSPVDRAAPKSMRLSGLDRDDNDLYLHQPQVLYNGQPVFVGHTNGKYVYYYEPASEPRGRQYRAGWCLSPHLGSGRSQTRLNLDKAISVEVAARSEKDKGLEQEDEAQPSMLQHLKTWVNTKASKTMAHKKSGMLVLGDEMALTMTAAGLTMTMATVVPMEKVTDVQVDWVPHATSLCMDAIASGNLATIDFVLQLYREQDPACLRWHYRTQEGLWEAYSPAEQREIHAAVAYGLPEVDLGSAEDIRTLQFEEGEEVWGTEKRPVRATMRAVVQHNRKGVTVSSVVEAVREWDGSCLVFAPSHAAAAARDAETLMFLVEEGVVDHGLWAPPCQGAAGWRILSDTFPAVLGDVMAAELRATLGDVPLLPSALAGLFESSDLRSRPAVHRTENRLTDGLDVAPQSDAELAFYAPTYSSPTWALPFCAALPANGQGYAFREELVLAMAAEALRKGSELQRQAYPQPLRPSLALFVYTYEMLSDQPTDQVYSCMNHAMRLRDAERIAFWRPLIWEIDQALQALPSLPTRSFRGINCEMNPALYKAGRHVCWPAFSSATQSQAVAEAFAKGESGTLFFLQGSAARHVARVSRYPDEDEVLFGPNTVFEVTSTLQQASDIGQFYGKVDNIALRQVGGSAAPGLKPRPVGYTSILVHVPPALGPRLIGWLLHMPTAAVESVDLVEERDDGISAHIVVGDGPCGVLLPNSLRLPSQVNPSPLIHLPQSPLEEALPDPLPTNSRVVTSARRYPPSPPQS
eukprot:EG_transcript_218